LTNHENEVTKADVQTTPLNKLPVPGQDDVEFSAEEAAEAFQQNPGADQTADHQGENE